MADGLLAQSLTVLLVAATPVIELRGAVPLGIGAFGMPVPLVMVLAFIGNLLPVIAIYALGGAWLSWVERRKGFFRRLTDATVNRARRAYTAKRAAYGAWALTLFVAVPLPVTGAVTGSVAAFAFGVPFRRAFVLIALGVAIADVIVTLATTGAIGAYGIIATS